MRSAHGIEYILFGCILGCNRENPQEHAGRAMVNDDLAFWEEDPVRRRLHEQHLLGAVGLRNCCVTPRLAGQLAREVAQNDSIIDTDIYADFDLE